MQGTTALNVAFPDEAPQTPTVFVVDDDPHFRSLIREVMESVDLQTETFASALHFLDEYNAARPGCLLLDVRMPAMGGMEVLRLISADQECLPIIMMTAFADVPTAVEAMQLGARDFLEKPYPPQLLIEKVQQALKDDQSRYHTSMADIDTTRGLRTLTPRELEILDLLVIGRDAKQIARELKISIRTVDFHRRNVLLKMQVENVVQLTRLLDEYRFRQLD